MVEDFTSLQEPQQRHLGPRRDALFKNLKMADNGIGFTQASGNSGRSAYTSRVVDSLFVGESENVGNPMTPSEKAYGRSLPQPESRGFPDPRLRVLRLPP